MANGNGDQTNPTIRGTILGVNPKVVLAFFLVIVAALMVIFLIVMLTGTTAKLDAGTIALFASMVTTFILMAKSGSDYQFSSSAGSDKKDDTQAQVSSKLADKVTAPAPLPPPAPGTSSTTTTSSDIPVPPVAPPAAAP